MPFWKPQDTLKLPRIPSVHLHWDHEGPQKKVVRQFSPPCIFLSQILVKAQMADGKRGDGRAFDQAVWQFRQLLKTLPGYTHLLPLPQTTQNTNTHTKVYSNTKRILIILWKWVSGNTQIWARAN